VLRQRFLGAAYKDVSVLLNKGDGAFVAAIDYPAGMAPSGVAVGDPSGDGRPDLAVTDSCDGKVGVLFNNCFP
jgi:hypothetical protein